MGATARFRAAPFVVRGGKDGNGRAAALRGRGFGDNAGLLWSHMFRVHVVIRGIKVKGIQGES